MKKGLIILLLTTLFALTTAFIFNQIRIPQNNINKQSEKISANTITKSYGGDYIKVKEVSAGGYHSLILSTDGVVYSFGSNEYGQLGIGITGGYYEYPQKVVSTYDANSNPNGFKNENIKSISAGNLFSIILTNDGVIYGFGANYHGQLGIGTYIDSNIPTKALNNTSSGFINNNITAIETTVGLGNRPSEERLEMAATMVLGAGGIAYSVGSNFNGYLGTGVGFNSSLTGTNRRDNWYFSKFQKVVNGTSGFSNSNVGEISISQNGGLVVKDGFVYTFGNQNALGFLAIGNESVLASTTPIRVINSNGFINGTVKMAKVGDGKIIVVDTYNIVYMAGQATYIGDGRTTGNAYSLVKVSNSATGSFKNDGSVSITGTSRIGEDVAGIVLQTGEVYVWGANRRGQLGVGETVDKTVPVKVNTNVNSGFNNNNVSSVSIGQNHILIIENDEVYSVGRNQLGQLGNGEFGKDVNEFMIKPLLRKPKFEVVGDYNSSGYFQNKMIIQNIATFNGLDAQSIILSFNNEEIDIKTAYLNETSGGIKKYELLVPGNYSLKITDSLEHTSIVNFSAYDKVKPIVKINGEEVVEGGVYYYNNDVEITVSDDFAGIDENLSEVSNEIKETSFDEQRNIYTVYDKSGNTLTFILILDTLPPRGKIK